MTIRRRKLAKGVAVAGLFAVLGTLFSWEVGAIGGNVHTVSEGKVYRSAQLSGPTFEDVLRRFRIKTVISVRGGEPGEERFDAEAATAARLGAQVISAPMSARELPPPDTLDRLIKAIDESPTPILIHCQGGADRSGFASAMYRILREGETVDKAQSEELTWHYGHFKFGEARPMDEFFDLYRMTSEGESMRRWIEGRYARLYADIEKGEAVHAMRDL